MAKPWLLKLTRIDEEQGFVLIHVTSKGKDGLDIDLLATEGSEVFKGKLKKADLKSLRAKTYNGRDEEWEAILEYVLLEHKSDTISQEQKESLEVGATVTNESGKPTLSITFRNRIDDITQRIGNIKLSQTSKEISLFDWAASAVDKSKAAEEELSILSRRTEENSATIAKLQTQLDDLVKAKTEHEEQLISKFVLLLAEKKAKIRDQQRILQTSNLERRRLDRVKDSVVGEPPLRTTRRSGRNATVDAADSDEDESQAFETRPGSSKRKADDHAEEDDVENDSERQTTPDSTESEASDENPPSPAKKTSSRRTKASPKSTKENAPAPTALPPKRDLPFAAKSGHNTRSKPKPTTPPPAEEVVTASEDDDDEL